MDDICGQFLEPLMTLLHSGNNKVAYEACQAIETGSPSASRASAQ